jgi:tuftelin-interacting protein 11
MGFSQGGGLGSSIPDEPTPSSFGAPSFSREQTSTPKPAVPLSATEAAHFSKLQGSFGARMLAKMGWEAGTGLGSTGEGIVTPVESKLRPQKMGIAFKGFKEKTDQSKMEAKRRGETHSDEEDGPKKSARGARKAQQEKRSDVWKQPKKAKIKVQHKTYEEIIAEAGPEVMAANVGIIIDATGATVRVFSFEIEVWLTSACSHAKYHHLQICPLTLGPRPTTLQEYQKFGTIFD